MTEEQKKQKKHVPLIHELVTIKSPIAWTVRCNGCGFNRVIPARQNARARASMVRGAYTEHAKKIAPIVRVTE